MIIWRIHWHTDAGNSAGYSYHRTKREAQAKIDEIVTRDEITEESGDMPRLIRIEVTVSAQGMLDALNVYAEHPDNG